MDHAYAQRRARLVPALHETAARTDLNALLVTDLLNVRYLCGFSGSNAALLVTSAGAVLATDGRYAEQARAESPDVELVITRALTSELAARTRAEGHELLGFEDGHLSVAAHRRLSDEAGDVRLVPAGRPVELLRPCKEEFEIDLLREACAIGDRALADVLPTIRPGLTERQVAHALEARMLAHGADARAFETIVATGPHSAIPHHQPTDRPIATGDLLKIDFGARYRGYHSDMTRTMVVGVEPKDWQRELYDVVELAQRRGREALGVDIAPAEVDAAARTVIVDAGYGDAFPHGLGHGVGLAVHEDPFLAASSTGKLQDRTPVTVEPGVYLPGRGGVRIEDTLVVRAGGAPELLTRTTKELLALH